MNRLVSMMDGSPGCGIPRYLAASVDINDPLMVVYTAVELSWLLEQEPLDSSAPWLHLASITTESGAEVYQSLTPR